jgi:2-methylisocitrate lyase-like PEP mutase family enzyme
MNNFRQLIATAHLSPIVNRFTAGETITCTETGATALVMASKPMNVERATYVLATVDGATSYIKVTSNGMFR